MSARRSLVASSQDERFIINNVNDNEGRQFQLSYQSKAHSSYKKGTESSQQSTGMIFKDQLRQSIKSQKSRKMADTEFDVPMIFDYVLRKAEEHVIEHYMKEATQKAIQGIENSQMQQRFFYEQQQPASQTLKPLNQYDQQILMIQKLNNRPKKFRQSSLSPEPDQRFNTQYLTKRIIRGLALIKVQDPGQKLQTLRAKELPDISVFNINPSQSYHPQTLNHSSFISSTKNKKDFNDQGEEKKNKTITYGRENGSGKGIVEAKKDNSHRTINQSAIGKYTSVDMEDFERFAEDVLFMNKVKFKLTDKDFSLFRIYLQQFIHELKVKELGIQRESLQSRRKKIVLTNQRFISTDRASVQHPQWNDSITPLRMRENDQAQTKHHKQRFITDTHKMFAQLDFSVIKTQNQKYIVRLIEMIFSTYLSLTTSERKILSSITLQATSNYHNGGANSLNVSPQRIQPKLQQIRESSKNEQMAPQSLQNSPKPPLSGLDMTKLITVDLNDDYNMTLQVNARNTMTSGNNVPERANSNLQNKPSSGFYLRNAQNSAKRERLNSKTTMKQSRKGELIKHIMITEKIYNDSHNLQHIGYGGKQIQNSFNGQKNVQKIDELMAHDDQQIV